MNIKTILIDIDNTLLDFGKSSLKAMDKVAKDFSIRFPENYFKTFKSVNDSLWHQYEKGLITKNEIYLRRWKEIFSILNIEADSDLFEKEFRYQVKLTAEKVDYAEDILLYLSNKYKLYAASNASSSQQHYRLEKACIKKYFTDFFFSEDIGFQKPSKEFFEYCIKSLNINDKNEIIMIGDSISADIIGAKNMGIKTIWFNIENEKLPDYSFSDYTVNSLIEIRNIL